MDSVWQNKGQINTGMLWCDGQRYIQRCSVKECEGWHNVHKVNTPVSIKGKNREGERKEEGIWRWRCLKKLYEKGDRGRYRSK